MSVAGKWALIFLGVAVGCYILAGITIGVSFAKWGRESMKNLFGKKKNSNSSNSSNKKSDVPSDDESKV